MNKYETIAESVLKDYPNVIIEYWKSNKPWSGRCYINPKRIRVPRPKSLISLCTLFHELGHLSNPYKLSCMNEYHACMFAQSKLREYGLPVTKDIKIHDEWYIAFSLAQALNRNLKTIPAELRKYKKLLQEYDMHVHYGNGNNKIVKRYKAIYRR